MPTLTLRGRGRGRGEGANAVLRAVRGITQQANPPTPSHVTENIDMTDLEPEQESEASERQTEGDEPDQAWGLGRRQYPLSLRPGQVKRLATQILTTSSALGLEHKIYASESEQAF